MGREVLIDPKTTPDAHIWVRHGARKSSLKALA